MHTLNRREFLRLCALVSAGVGLGWDQRALAAPAGTSHPSQGAGAANSQKLYLPMVANNNSPPLVGRVAHVHSQQATHWNGEVDWWNHTDQAKIDTMVEAGLRSLTSASSLANAWHALIPGYQVGQKIAIKANLNNSHACGDADSQVDACIQVVNALARGLKLIGASEADIWVYDAARYISNRFVGGCSYPGVRFYGLGGCQLPATFASTAPGSTITFNPPPGAPNPGTIKVTDVLVNADYVINMPIMKNHVIAGVTLGFKNHFGSTNNPAGMHANIDLGGAGYRSDYNALVDLYQNPHIGAKTVLTVGDGLFASKTLQSGSPSLWNSFGVQLPNSLFFSADPVAVDCVMCDFLAAELTLTQGYDDYLRLASQAGLGVYERGNPRGSGYQQIQYLYLDL